MSTRTLRVVLVALSLLGTAGQASAYCVGRTCDPTDPEQACETDREGCVISGAPLHWVSSCVTFDVQRDGSPKSDLDADRVTDSAERAFGAWMKAACGDERPSLQIGTFGPVACAESRYNEKGRNANIILFHDDEWPYPGAIDTFGFTRVRFNVQTGEIYDADVELNSADFDLTTDERGDGVDLQSILTHEFGHFFGLAHPGSDQSDATMRANWDGSGTALRTLADDDASAICDSYPPGRKAPSTCEPRHGFASDCFVPIPASTRGGACAAAPDPLGAEGAKYGAAALLVLALQRRRARNAPRSAKLWSTSQL